MAAIDSLIAVWNTTGLPANTIGTGLAAGDNAQTKIDKIATWRTQSGAAQPARLTQDQVLEALDPAETLSAAGVPQYTQLQLTFLNTILIPTIINASPGTNTRGMAQRFFSGSGKTQTWANLQALVAQYDNFRIPWWQFVLKESPFTLGDARAAGLS